MQALYRAGRARALTPTHQALFAPPFAAALRGLLAKPPRGLDLASELRGLLVLLNRGRGRQARCVCVWGGGELRGLLVLLQLNLTGPPPSPSLAPPRSVASLQAAGVAVCGAEGLAAEGRWVDFGTHGIALTLRVRGLWW